MYVLRIGGMNVRSSDQNSITYSLFSHPVDWIHINLKYSVTISRLLGVFRSITLVSSRFWTRYVVTSSSAIPVQSFFSLTHETSVSIERASN